MEEQDNFFNPADDVFMQSFGAIHNKMVAYAVLNCKDSRLEKLLSFAGNECDNTKCRKIQEVYARFAFYCAECYHERLNQKGITVLKLLPLVIYKLVVEDSYYFQNITMDEFVFIASETYNEIMVPDAIKTTSKLGIDLEPYVISFICKKILAEYSPSITSEDADERIKNSHLLETKYFDLNK